MSWLKFDKSFECVRLVNTNRLLYVYTRKEI